MKYKRQSKILELIGAFDIYTQDELADRLGRNGFTATQATISRDIKELKLLKVPASNGQYKYASANSQDEDRANVKFLNILNETIIAIQTAKNLMVVKTHTGMAQAAAAAVDAIDFPEIIGTVAGDDTIFIAFASDENAEVTAQKLGKMIR
ncbi:MAG: arginine repressor [Oscillospiraceae bacterium]|nr:arginine repressor [Oscillospiraceae bacterium]